MNKSAILFINLAKGLGGGEVQTEQLMQSLLPKRTVYFYGHPMGAFATHLHHSMPTLPQLNLRQMIKLVMQKQPLIIHAHDGRGAHLAGYLKKISGKPMVITRHVAFPLKRRWSQYSYRIADALVGVSQQVSALLKPLNPQTHTIYGCVKPLLENNELDHFFHHAARLRVAQIGSLQAVKNVGSTIDLAKHCTDIHFYIVGSGDLEATLRAQAVGLNNITFLSHTNYIANVFKQIDVQILPSHSEGLAMVILEGYQYCVPVLAHAVGGIPEIVVHGETGFLIKNNDLKSYQSILAHLDAAKLHQLRQGIERFLQQHDFSPTRMATEYEQIYQMLE